MDDLSSPYHRIGKVCHVACEVCGDIAECPVVCSCAFEHVAEKVLVSKSTCDTANNDDVCLEEIAGHSS